MILSLSIRRVALILCFITTACVFAQQRIVPVTNHSIEEPNVHFDEVGYTEVHDSVFYFAFRPSRPQTVLASNGTSTGTKLLGRTGSYGGEIIFAFLHGADYYYVLRQYQATTQLRRANYQAGSDELVIELPKVSYDQYITTRDLGNGKTLLMIRASGELELYLLDDDGEFRALPVPAFLQENDFSYPELRGTAPIEGILVETRNGDGETEYLAQVDVVNDVVDTLVGFPPPTYYYGSTQAINDRLYHTTVVDRQPKIYVYDPDGTPLDTLHFPTPNPPFIGGLSADDGLNVYFFGFRQGESQIYHYRPGGDMSLVETVKFGRVLNLVTAPGPLGPRTPYLLMEPTSGRLQIRLLHDGTVGEEVTTVSVYRYGNVYEVGPTPEGLLIRVPTASSTVQLFYTDGTPENSRFVAAADAPYQTVWEESVTVTNDRVYFVGEDAEGLTQLYQFSPHGTDLTVLTDFEAATPIYNLLPFRGGVIFRAAGRGDNAEWWIAAPGTSPPKKVIELDNDESNSGMVLLGPDDNGDLLFTMNRAYSTAGLFRSGGTDATTEPILDGVAAFTSPAGVRVGSRYIFYGNLTRDGESHQGLLTTDGTVEGTYPLTEGKPHDIVTSGDRVFFAVENELYVTDGTPAGTRLAFQLDPTVNSAAPTHLVPLGGGVVFAGWDYQLGYGLWFSDGTPTGTHLIKAFSRSEDDLAAFSSTGEVVYFMVAHSFDNSLWRTDGTEEGTTRIKAFDGRVDAHYHLRSVIFRDRLYFSGVTEADGWQVWVTDGQEASTRMLPDVTPQGDDFFATRFTVAGNYLYYQTNLGLYRTDGSPAGTVRLYDGRMGEAVVHNELLYFTSATDAFGEELFRTDGTVAGTQLVEDYYPGPGSASPGELTSTGEGLYFSAIHPRIGKELHRLADCPRPEDFTLIAGYGVDSVLLLGISPELGGRSLVITSASGPVWVTDYADTLQITGAPGTRFTAEFTVDAGSACGVVSRPLSGAFGEVATVSVPADGEDPPLSLRLYPNPAPGGSVRLEVRGAEGGGTWQLHDMHGRPCSGGTFGGEAATISTINHAPGTYFLFVTTASRRIIGTLLIQ